MEGRKLVKGTKKLGIALFHESHNHMLALTPPHLHHLFGPRWFALAPSSDNFQALEIA